MPEEVEAALQRHATEHELEGRIRALFWVLGEEWDALEAIQGAGTLPIPFFALSDPILNQQIVIADSR
jgi:hypothetical protein